MANEPDNLVLVMLREIRVKQDAMQETLSKLDKGFETFKFQLTHAFGLASMANLQSLHTETKLEEIKARQKQMAAAFKKLEEEVRAT